MDAVLMAGGRIDWAGPEGTDIKALLRLDGITLLARVLSALRASRSIERICVTGSPAIAGEAHAYGADLFVPEGETAVDNLMAGLDVLNACGPVLVSACDLPLLRGEDVDEVIERTPPDAGLSYTAISKEAWLATFPASTKRFIRLADGELVGGSLFVQHAEALRRIEPLLHRAFGLRKNQVGMAWLLGAGTLLRLAAGYCLHPRLGPRLEELRRQAERITGSSCAIVWNCPARIGADVDHRRAWEDIQRIAAGG